MNISQRSFMILKPYIFTQFLFLLILTFLSSSIVAQTQTNNSSNKNNLKKNNKLKSKVINKIPKHLPIEVELINDDKEDILKDLEVKVTNTGDKPIYFLNFKLRTLDVKAYGVPISHRFILGNSSFTNPENIAVIGYDEGLAPNETHLFKFSPKYSENAQNKQGLWEFTPFPHKFELIFQFLSFGDGSGFMNTSGRAYPIISI